MSERESIGRTLGVAAAVAVFCSLFVTSAVTWLRPYQLAYQSLERNRALLEAAALAERGDALADREVVSRFLRLQAHVIDLEAGAFTDEVAAAGYDYRDGMVDPVRRKKIPKELDIAGIGHRPRHMPAYVSYDGGDIEFIVLPVYGRGMWSTIHGYVSLEADLATIRGASFHEHGETPGIGDRIEAWDWLAQWSGRRLYDESGNLVFRIGADQDDAGLPGGIDAITGATITVSAIERSVRYWFGGDGYGRFLAELRGAGR